MQNLFSKLEAIDLKIRQLVQKMELLKKENKQLIEENARIKKEKSQYLDKIDLLSVEVRRKDQNNISTSISKSSDNKQIKEELDAYITEIDACIDLLNN